MLYHIKGILELFFVLGMVILILNVIISTFHHRQPSHLASNIKRSIGLLLILLYCCSVIYVLFSRPSPGNRNPWNFELFLCYKELLYDFSNNSIINVVGNLVLFLPLGFIIAYLLLNRKKIWFALSIGILSSLSVEVFQWLSGIGIADVDDLFNNTLGYVSGMLLFTSILELSRKHRKTAITLFFISALPFLLVVCAFISYISKPYGNTEFDGFNGLKAELCLDERIPDIQKLEVFKVQPGSIEKAYSVADKLFSSLGTSTGEDCTKYENDVVLYDQSHQKVLWYSLSDGTYEYTNISSLFESNSVETIATQNRVQAILTLLELFGIDVPNNAIIEPTENDGFQVFDNIDGVYMPIVSGKCRNNSIERLQCRILQKISIGAVSMPSEKQLQETIKSGNYYIVPRCDFAVDSVMHMTSSKITYIKDTKGFYRPFLFMDVTFEGTSALAIIDLLYLQSTNHIVC